jgi:hypothetical protein
VPCPHHFVGTPPESDALRLLNELEGAHDQMLKDSERPDDDEPGGDDEDWDAFHVALDALGSELTVYCGIEISIALAPLAGVDERELLWTSGAQYFACTDAMTSYLPPEGVTVLAARLASLSATDVHQALKRNPSRRAPLREVITEAEALVALITTAATNGHGLLVQFDC